MTTSSPSSAASTTRSPLPAHLPPTDSAPPAKSRSVDELRRRGHRADHLVDRGLANKRTPDQTVFGTAAEYPVLIAKTAIDH